MDSTGASSYNGAIFSPILPMKRFLLSGATLALSSVLSVGVAYADDIVNDLDLTPDPALEVMNLTVGGANGTANFSVVQQNGDGKNGCNFTSSKTMTVTVNTSNAAVATVSPTPLTFSSCGDIKTVTVTPVGAGTATITLTETANTTGGSFNYANASFTVNVSVAQAHLIVIKHVVNDNGGTAAAGAFTMTINGVSATGGNSFAGQESPGTDKVVTPGAYSVSETGPAGYAATYSADCSGTIAAGQTKTCTVTNDDIAPQLTVIKHVVNDHGGTFSAADFTMNVTGASPSPSSFAGSEAGTLVTLNAGSYSVGETGPAGYAASMSSDCSGSIAIGESKTCTVTNNDVAPQLTVIKHVVTDNGGTAVAGDFTMNVTATDPSQASFPGNEAGTTITLDAGSYSVGETGPSGYAPSLSADCSGSIGIGQTKTCTVTNDDIQPKLTVIKHVVNDHGGSAVAGDFTMNVTGSAAAPSSFAGSEAGTLVALNAGAYSVGETGPAGYAASPSVDCSGSIAVGEEKTCTLTNDDMPAEIRGMKFEDLNGNGVKDLGEPGLAGWTIELSGDATDTEVTDVNGVYAFTGLSVGTYTVTEQQQAGWTQMTADPAPVTVGLGDVVTNVDFGNFENVAVTGYKWHDRDADAAKGTLEEYLPGWTMFIDEDANGLLDSGEQSAVTDVNGVYTLSDLAPGTYTVCEQQQLAWVQTFPLSGVCHTVTVSQSGVNVTGKNFGNLNEHTGGIGFWRNWNRHNTYTETQINGWLATLDADSAWLMTEAGYGLTASEVTRLVNDATKSCDNKGDKTLCAKRKFLAQYMAVRLNILSGRKGMNSFYDLTAFPTAMSYLGISPVDHVLMSTFVTQVEAKAATNPNRQQFLQMMEVADHINNQGI